MSCFLGGGNLVVKKFFSREKVNVLVDFLLFEVIIFWVLFISNEFSIVDVSNMDVVNEV